jgi:aminopeptidase N
VTPQGDPTNTDSSNYIVAFAAPSGYRVVTSGAEFAKDEADGQVIHRVVGALVRNMVVVASDRLSVASQRVGDVTVNAYFRSGDEQGGKATLATAARSLALFSKQFGPYPYTELDVAEVQLGGGAAGMESTGLIMIGSDYYDPSNSLANLGALGQGANGLDVLAFTTAHETAHQWWYGVVGSDAYLHPWLDESLTNWSSAFYTDSAAGADAGALARDVFIALPYHQILAQGDQQLDQPVDKFSEIEYGAVVYGKGALMYDVLRKQLGDEKFFDFLRRYYDQHRFERVDSMGWRDTLAEVAGQQAATAFYQKWVVGNTVKEDDLPAGGPLSGLFGGLDGLLSTPTPSK